MTKQSKSQNTSDSEMSPEILGELLNYMDKRLAALMVLSYLSSKKTRDMTVQALYEVEYFNSKKKQIEELADTEKDAKQKAIKDLRKNGFLIS